MMAPYNGDSMLLNQPAMVQAQSNGQVEAINALSGLIPQRGGSRSRWSRRSRRSRRQRGGMEKYSASSLMSQLASMSGTQSGSSRSRRSRRQRGGMACFDSAFATPRVQQGAEMNPQFRTEASVNPSYGESRGAQA